MDGYGNQVWYVRASNRAKITDWSTAVVGGVAAYDINLLTLDQAVGGLRTQLWWRAGVRVTDSQVAAAIAAQDAAAVPAVGSEPSTVNPAAGPGGTIQPGSITALMVAADVATQAELDNEATARTTGDTSKLAKAANLSDLASAATARTNLGLGGAATISATAGGDLSGTLPSPTVARVNGVAVTGTPTAGMVPTATSGTAATWQAPAAGAGDATTSTKGVVQLGGDLAGTALAPSVAKVNGVAVSGTPSVGMVPTATSGTAATWQTPATAPVTQVAGRTGAIILGQSDITNLTGDLGLKAPLASPALTGTPTVPTATADTNTTQIASTAFVLAQAASVTPLVDGTGTAGTATRLARADHVHPTDTSRAPLASPALTGTPTVPTATADTSTTQVASTAFVLGQAASATPLADGTAAVGTSTRMARGDHRHPTDTTRASAATTITAGTGLNGGGDLSADRTLSVAYGTSSTTATRGDDTRVVNAVQSTTVPVIVALTQAAYDALTPSATTLYVVVG